MPHYPESRNRRDDNGDILIYGTSYQRYVDALWEKHPALWFVDIDGTFSEPVDLGLPSFALEVEPTGFNSWGVGVGWTRRAIEKDEEGNWVFPSWVDVPGPSYQELPTFLGRNSHANAINNAGVIVGTLTIEDSQSPSGFWTVGALWQLNPDGSISDPISLGDFYPEDINNHGVIAGRAISGYPAIAWFDGTSLVVKPLETSEQRYHWADVNALNDYPIGDDRLTVVGESFAGNTGEAYAWRPFDTEDPTTLLGTLGGNTSVARDVNTRGEIVGWSDTRKHGQQAFIYSDGMISNLNSMTEVGANTLQWAYGINDDGDIVGFMRIPRPVSEQRGFLLRPIEQN